MDAASVVELERVLHVRLADDLLGQPGPEAGLGLGGRRHEPGAALAQHDAPRVEDLELFGGLLGAELGVPLRAPVLEGRAVPVGGRNGVGVWGTVVSCWCLLV